MKGMYLLNSGKHIAMPQRRMEYCLGILLHIKVFYTPRKRDSVLLFFPLSRAVPINK